MEPIYCRRRIQCLKVAHRDVLPGALAVCLEIDAQRRISGGFEKPCTLDHRSSVRPDSMEQQHGADGIRLFAKPARDRASGFTGKVNGLCVCPEICRRRADRPRHRRYQLMTSIQGKGHADQNNRHREDSERSQSIPYPTAHFL